MSITKAYVFKAIEQITEAEITSKALLGYSSDTFILYENKESKEERGRCSEISMRNHSGDLSLLITDAEGGFIFNGSWNLLLDQSLLAEEAFRAIDLFKEMIHDTIDSKTTVFVKKTKTNEHVQ